MFNSSLLNLIVWLMVVGICAYCLYYEDSDKPLRRVIECETLVLCLSASESLGEMLIQWILQLMEIKVDEPIMLHCLEMTFSKIVLIFLYYAGISRLMRKNHVLQSKIQYRIYVIILAYSLINMLVIAEGFVQRKANYLWVVSMGCIVLADLYLLYFVKIANEKNYYENQVELLKQQASMQYQYYVIQAEKYNTTIQILHDVDKHIKVIEELHMSNQGDLAVEYAKQINRMLNPLIPTKYTGNPILDILLTDKVLSMKEKNIQFEAQIDNVDLKHIEPINATIIFGNLLDNSIEAAEKVNGKKSIRVKVGAYRQIVAVRIENCSNCVQWKNGMPVSKNGKDRGIGILNVQQCIKKYDGDIKWKQL
ncbi:GHKL domain-containing protein [Lachnospiraceae bacterium ZAX-1]